MSSQQSTCSTSTMEPYRRGILLGPTEVHINFYKQLGDWNDKLQFALMNSSSRNIFIDRKDPSSSFHEQNKAKVSNLIFRTSTNVIVDNERSDRSKHNFLFKDLGKKRHVGSICIDSDVAYKYIQALFKDTRLFRRKCKLYLTEYTHLQAAQLVSLSERYYNSLKAVIFEGSPWDSNCLFRKGFDYNVLTNFEGIDVLGELDLYVKECKFDHSLSRMPVTISKSLASNNVVLINNNCINNRTNWEIVIDAFNVVYPLNKLTVWEKALLLKFGEMMLLLTSRKKEEAWENLKLMTSNKRIDALYFKALEVIKNHVKPNMDLSLKTIKRSIIHKKCRGSSL